MNLQEFAKEILPVVQAASEGKKIQHRYRDRKISVIGDFYDVESLKGFPVEFEYRIKPEPKLRPYTREEWEKVLRVRNKVTNATLLVKEIGDHYVVIGEDTALLTFREAMVRYVNLDGSPCGVEVTE